MTDWDERPIELRTHFNPAFIAVLIAEAAAGYEGESNRALPYVLAFLAAPVVAHEPTRRTLPTIATSMFAWLDRQPQARLQIPELAQQFVPVIREAIQFGACTGAFRLSSDGGLVPGGLLKPPQGSQTADVSEGLKRARFVGRWFARAGDTGTILASWGLTV